jgi:hypothetical protein
VELASCWARLRAGRVGRKEADRMHRKRRQTTIFGKPRKCVRAAAAAFGSVGIYTDAVRTCGVVADSHRARHGKQQVV